MKSLMIHGTSSNCGKTFITLALCRLLANEGYKVAPFKSQNISLNSFVNESAEEIGYAQYLQSCACKTVPSFHFNPVLIKISNENCQFIINGKLHHVGRFSDYKKLIPIMRKAVIDSIDYLKEHYDFLIIEGAGSPVEINFNTTDISNILPVTHLNSPILLVSDIDRGGAFASVVGTLELYPEEVRKFVKGFIFNKICGDKLILLNGTNYIEKKYNIRYLGALEHSQVKIPDEDFGYYVDKNENEYQKDALNVTVIKTPNISNTSDFAVFEANPTVNYTLSSDINDIENAHVIILPGSKNVFQDLEFIRESSIEKCIKRHIEKGKTVIGICGGYQMLHTEIVDNHNVESQQSKIIGLGLLNGKTEFQTSKTTKNVRFIINYANKTFEGVGFEIHNGRTAYLNTPFIFNKDTNETLGTFNYDFNVWGTYIHDFFRNEDFMNEFISFERKKNGLSECNRFLNVDIDNGLEQISNLLSNSIDIDYLKMIL